MISLHFLFAPYFLFFYFLSPPLLPADKTDISAFAYFAYLIAAQCKSVIFIRPTDSPQP